MSQKKIQEQKVISISCTTICWVYRGGLPGILTCGVGWGGVGCVNVGVHVYTWYAAGVLMCTHGTWGGVGWGGVGCVNVGVHVYTWYAAGVLMCTHGTLLVCSCVHMVRCWCVHVYTWYAAGVFIVHMVRCWCVMCKRFTQSQCHV